jgi:hypothetical protein
MIVRLAASSRHLIPAQAWKGPEVAQVDVPPLPLPLHETDASSILRYGGPDLHFDYALAVDSIIVKHHIFSHSLEEGDQPDELSVSDSGVNNSQATPSNSLGGPPV